MYVIEFADKSRMSLQSFRDTHRNIVYAGDIPPRDILDSMGAKVVVDEALLIGEIRQTRNTMLAESDWTQVADVPVDQAAWAAYRQALRDITAQEGFPFNVTWPVKP